MVESLLKRAKAFMGFDLEEGETAAGSASQLPISSILRGRRESVRDKSEYHYEIMISEPRVYEDSLGISANLRSGSPVLINLKNLDPVEGTRLIDFVCGTAYAIDGHMVKIVDTIFLFTPSTIKVTDSEEKNASTDDFSAFGEKKEILFSRH